MALLPQPRKPSHIYKIEPAHRFLSLGTEVRAMAESINITNPLLQPYEKLIEEILTDFGIDPAKNSEVTAENRHSWFLQRGTASVFVEIFSEEQEGYFMVDCPLLLLPPENREAFYLHLLKLNDQLVEASFVVRENEVHLVGIRPLKGLDAQEAKGMLDRISAWADSLDEPLSEEFKAPLWES